MNTVCVLYSCYAEFKLADRAAQVYELSFSLDPKRVS